MPYFIEAGMIFNPTFEDIGMIINPASLKQEMTS